MIVATFGISPNRYVMLINGNNKYGTTFNLPETSTKWLRIIDTGSWAEIEGNFWPTGNPLYDKNSKDNHWVDPKTIVVFKEKT